MSYIDTLAGNKSAYVLFTKIYSCLFLLFVGLFCDKRILAIMFCFFLSLILIQTFLALSGLNSNEIAFSQKANNIGQFM